MADTPGSERLAARDSLYEQATREFGGALQRLARAYETDADRRQDLLQDIHIELWRSLAIFDGRCSLRTWVYRVAHNVATTEVIRRRSKTPILVDLDDLDLLSDRHDREDVFDRQRSLDRLYQLIHSLKPGDRQVILMYLEGLDAASIGEISGISSGNVATKIHRIKQILARRFHREGL